MPTKRYKPEQIVSALVGWADHMLGPNVTLTLNACHVGFGGRISIAQIVANRLKRTLFAYPEVMYFSSDPTPRRFTPNVLPQLEVERAFFR
jgi:hypothetical protein